MKNYFNRALSVFLSLLFILPHIALAQNPTIEGLNEGISDSIRNEVIEKMVDRFESKSNQRKIRMLERSLIRIEKAKKIIGRLDNSKIGRFLLNQMNKTSSQNDALSEDELDVISSGSEITQEENDESIEVASAELNKVDKRTLLLGLTKLEKITKLSIESLKAGKKLSRDINWFLIGGIALGAVVVAGIVVGAIFAPIITLKAAALVLLVLGIPLAISLG